MTTNEAHPPGQTDRMGANLKRIEALSQRLVAAMAQKRSSNAALEGPGIELFAKAAGALWNEAMTNPGRMIEQQAGLWAKALQNYTQLQHSLTQDSDSPPPPSKDRRFANPLWQTNPYFAFVRQQYETNVEAMETALSDLSGLEPGERRRVDYFTRQIIDMMAPTNFLATNPDALEKAVATEGESLVAGLENLVRDIEANHGDLIVTLADKKAFTVGQNLAATEGRVVFRNRLMELIQYSPMTEKVHATPLVIFPPWINKFYILDLKPQNSLIRWVVEQGFTLFVVSWKNPHSGYADVGMDDYVEEGFQKAISVVKEITGQDRVNTVGYCIAGTTLSLTLALMKHQGDKSVESATFFTTLTDFSDPGEISVFLGNDFVDGIETECRERGYLDKYFMSRTFSFMRANDLVYAPAIKSYMLGEAPPAFDLLYWNGDGTNLPARMAVEYLRGLCQGDGLAKGTFQICGQEVSLKDVKVPLCAIACETDHIAPWKASYAGIRQMGSKDKTFILAESGHIAGIVSPPTKEKYGHYTNAGPMDKADRWKDEATFHKGSWWPRWGAWLAERSGKMVAARTPGSAAYPAQDAAPGRYVTETPNG